MKRLFEKNEIRFALVFIVIYVIGSSLTDQISLGLPSKAMTLFFDLILSAVLLGFILKNKLREYYGLIKPQEPAKKLCFFAPLLVLATVNIWFGFKNNTSAIESTIYVLSMFLVGFLEEIIFRGLLFKAMSKGNLKSAIAVSSITFGIGHIVNLINGRGADFTGNLCQVCYAVAIGFLFVILFIKTKSLIPQIITHGVLNALSIFADNEKVTSLQIPISLALILISLGYVFILSKTLPEGKE